VTICAGLSDGEITRCWLFGTDRLDVGVVQTHRSFQAVKQDADIIPGCPTFFEANGADRSGCPRDPRPSELTEANPVAGLELVRPHTGQLISELQVFLDGSSGPLHDGWIAAAGSNDRYFPIGCRAGVPGLLDRNGIDPLRASASSVGAT
jgi:hypothetical protein